jgi:hypothetical protein
MDLRKKNPYALYRLATVADSQDGSLPVGTKLLPADIAPSGVFNIPVGAQYVSACQIVKLNNGWAHWTKKDKKGVDRTNNLCKDDFTAQTTIASSYGYMQVLYSTAIAPMQWTGNPSLLFDTSANLASDRGSLSLGTSYLQTLCWKVDTVDFYADGGNVSWQNEDDMRSAFEQAWIKYNGGEEYGGKVSDRVDTYLPVPSSTTVFGVTQ